VPTPKQRPRDQSGTLDIVTEPGRDAAFTTFTVLREVAGQGGGDPREVIGILDGLETRHGREAVAFCAHLLATQLIAAWEVAHEDRPIAEVIDAQEQVFLNQQYPS
jgi:hypothetical protein